MRLSIKHVAVVLVLGLAFVAGLASPSLLKASVLSYGDKEFTLEEDVIRFHLAVNSLVNDYLDVLTTEESPVVDYPGSEEGCTEENVGTFCLAVALNDELRAFESGMLYRREQFRDDEDEATISLEDAIEAQSNRIELIDSEVEAARKAVDLTLAVYNEAQLAYPLHQEFVQLIRNLEDFRDELALVRDSVELYPARFHNATTIQCK